MISNKSSQYSWYKGLTLSTTVQVKRNIKKLLLLIQSAFGKVRICKGVSFKLEKEVGEWLTSGAILYCYDLSRCL